MTIHNNEERKAAIRRAIDDGAIPTDEPLFCTYIDVYCPECERDTPSVKQLGIWSHIGKMEKGPAQNMECWTCGTNQLQLKAFCIEWDAPLERLPSSAIPEEYHSE